MMKFVSIVMPSFNSSLYIRDSIKSVLNQSHQQWELIVVDGGSTDNTASIVKSFSVLDYRIRLVKNIDDRGPAHARASGIRLAKGDCIAFLDADDLWLPQKLKLQTEFMIKNNCLFSYTGYRKMDAAGRLATCVLSTHTSFSFLSGLSRRGIGTPTVMIDRSVFDEDILGTIGKSHGEDMLWWLLILKKGVKAHCLLKPLALYRGTPNSLSKKLIRHQFTVWHSYRNELRVPCLLALPAYVFYLIDVFIRRLRLMICTNINGRALVATLMVEGVREFDDEV